jgi:hypothetical protein
MNFSSFEDKNREPKLGNLKPESTYGKRTAPLR